MMKNENFIISNSSFSLMAAFLNESENSKIIFPIHGLEIRIIKNSVKRNGFQ